MISIKVLLLLFIPIIAIGQDTLIDNQYLYTYESMITYPKGDSMYDGTVVGVFKGSPDVTGVIKTFRRGQLHGKLSLYKPDGSVYAIIPYKRGKAHGRSIESHFSMPYRGKYWRGVKHGKWKDTVGGWDWYRRGVHKGSALGVFK